MDRRQILLQIVFGLLLLALSGGALAQNAGNVTAFEMRWSPDGRWIGVGSSDGIWIFDTAKLDAEPYHYAEGGYACVVAFDPVRPYAAFAPDDGEQVQVIEIETGDEIFRARTPIGDDEYFPVYYDLGYSDDGQYLSILNTSMVYVLDAATGSMVLMFPNTAPVPSYAGAGWMTSLDFASDGEMLLVGDWSAHLFEYDLDSRKNSMIHNLDINSGEGYRLEDFEVIPETDSILLLGWGALSIYDLDTRAMMPFGDLDEHVDGFDLSPDGTQVAVGAGATWYLYDLEGDRQTGEFASDFGEVWSARIYSLAFSPDGDRVAILQTDGRLKIWDVAIGEVVAQLGAFSGGMSQKWG